jgi:hypothetical protein
VSWTSILASTFPSVCISVPHTSLFLSWHSQKDIQLHSQIPLLQIHHERRAFGQPNTLEGDVIGRFPTTRGRATRFHRPSGEHVEQNASVFELVTMFFFPLTSIIFFHHTAFWHLRLIALGVHDRPANFQLGILGRVLIGLAALTT